MKINRRQLFQVSLSTGGSLMVSSGLFSCQTIGHAAKPIPGDDKTFQTIYLEVTADNQFYLTFDRVEMGQGVITGKATIFGEEADINPSRFMMRPAMADDRFGMQATGGSSSTR